MTGRLDAYHGPDIMSLFKRTRMEEIMTTPVAVVDVYEDISRVEELFVNRHTSHVCVVDDDGRLMGLVSQKYLYKARSPQRIMPGQQMENDRNIIIDGGSFYDRNTLDGYILHDVMDKLVSTLQPEDTLDKAIHLMARMGNDCIVIVNQNHKVRGILKEKNIIQFSRKTAFNGQDKLLKKWCRQALSNSLGLLMR